MMMPPMGNPGERMTPMPRLVAVAIDRDKGSQISLKWTVDNLLGKGHTVVLVHVRVKQTSLSTLPSMSIPRPNYTMISDSGQNGSTNADSDAQLKELFLPFRVFCTRKDVGIQNPNMFVHIVFSRELHLFPSRHLWEHPIQCCDVVLDDADVARALCEFVKQSAIDVLVLGAGAKGSVFRFKAKDIPGTVLKGVPDYCTVYIVHKGKISSTRAASRLAPSILTPLRNQIMLQTCSKSIASEASLPSSNNSRSSISGSSRPGSEPSPHSTQNEANFIKSPFTHRKAPNGKPYEHSVPDTDISFVSSGPQENVRFSITLYNNHCIHITNDFKSGCSDD